MLRQSARRAIKAALNGSWSEAIEYNLQILNEDPENIEALNRMAKAYASLGQTKKAKKTWNKVLSIDRYNLIATQQLNKLKSGLAAKQTNHKISTSGETFIDEPGKTKTVALVRLADVKTLMSVEPGQSVILVPKRRFVVVTTESGEYLGALPDDLSLRLIKMIAGGNKYEALIRRVQKNTVYVFIKEAKQALRYKDTPSFNVKKRQKTRVMMDTSASINEAPIDISPTGEEDSK